jgi:hypothetical protein
MVRDEATGAHELRARRMKMFLTMTLDGAKKKKEAHVCRRNVTCSIEEEQ